MIKILSIGNSFSQDAQAYLYQTAKSSNIDIVTVNLMIGGCSLQTHWENVLNNSSEYDFEQNGEFTSRKISIMEALKKENWDYITLQQASHDSGREDTYYPYINYLSDYVKNYAPQAEQLIHQTWAYELDSDHSGFKHYDNDQKIMFAALKEAYRIASEKLGLRIIPCGEAMQKARSTALFDYESGGKSLCRDGFHATLTLGRYLLGAVWYEVFTGKSILENSYVPVGICDEAAPALEELEVLKHCAHETVLRYK
jgi:hypothetical protein